MRKPVVTLAPIALCVMVGLYWLHTKKKSTEDAAAGPTACAENCHSDDDKSVIYLMEGEYGGNIYAPSINSVTFYEGKVNVEFLKAKVMDIVSANPWLLSRLVQNKQFNPTLVAVHPKVVEDSSNIDSIFSFTTDTALSRDMPYEEMSNHLMQYTAKKGSECINKDESQFKVTLLEIKKDAEYALVVSLSHVIGDGQTFYRLYAMLDTQTPAKPLIATRNHNFSSAAWDGRLSFKQWLASPFVIAGVVSTLLFRRKPVAVVYAVNKEEVERRKAQYSAAAANLAETTDSHDSSSSDKNDNTVAKFVSTNDVLTSWFFNISRSAYGMMAINFRERLPAFTADHAGNYQSLIMYSASDYSQPSSIRQSLATYKSQSDGMPTWYETVELNVSTITNWSSFYTHVSISAQSELVMHLPIISMKDMIFRNCGWIFNLNKTELGVFCASRNMDIDAVVKKRQNFCGEMRGGGSGTGDSSALENVDVLGRKVM